MGLTNLQRWDKYLQNWRVALILCLFLAMIQGYRPSVAWSQRLVTEGMGKGEKDTLRLDLRVKGEEEKDAQRRVTDQQIGWEERALRAELKEKELLRREAEEMAHMTRMQMESEAEDLEEREREDARVKEKKWQTIIRMQ